MAKDWRRFATEREVISELVKDYFEETNSPPDFFIGIIRKIVNHKDIVHSSNDPFYNLEDNKQRVTEGGKMKSPLDRKYAFVEIPDFFEQQGSIETLLRVLISKEKEEGKKLTENELIKVKFESPEFYENPIFDGRPSKEKVFQVAKNLNNEKKGK